MTYNVSGGTLNFIRSEAEKTAPHTWNSLQYYPTLDPAVLWTPSNDTTRLICSDSLNLMPPAPLYLRTLWRYKCCYYYKVTVGLATRLRSSAIPTWAQGQKDMSKPPTF